MRLYFARFHGMENQEVKPLNFAQLEDLQRELEETRELANNRLQELDKLHQQHRDTLKEVEKLKMDVSSLIFVHITFAMHGTECKLMSCAINTHVTLAFSCFLCFTSLRLNETFTSGGTLRRKLF